MTTNQVEKLDEALLRPGRIDYRLYLGKGERPPRSGALSQVLPGLRRTFEAREFVEASRSAETMAEFQGLLLALEQGEERLELAAA